MATGDLTRIRTNISALNALNALQQINLKLTKTNLKLATGKRINSAGDDPAGLTLANTLDLRARRIAAAVTNIGDASNVLAIAEGGLKNIADMLSQMEEKIILAANDTNGPSEKAAIQQELNQLAEEIDEVAATTQFNGVVLLTVGGLTFQTGPDGVNINRFSLTHAFTSAALRVNQLTVATQALASQSLASVSAALASVAAALQLAGSTIERLRIRGDNLTVAQLNLRAAESRIRDADLAAEDRKSVV